MRKSITDAAPRTIRVHIPTYNHILRYFRESPSGLRGSDAIRLLLMEFGKYCKRQMDANRTASSADLAEAENLVFRTMGEKDAK